MKLIQKLLTAKKFSVEDVITSECAETFATVGYEIREMTTKVVTGMVTTTAKETAAVLNKNVPEEPEPDPDKKSDSEVEDQTSKTD